MSLAAGTEEKHADRRIESFWLTPGQIFLSESHAEIRCCAADPERKEIVTGKVRRRAVKASVDSPVALDRERYYV
ncbi:MAG TPA: hypothetical protein VGA88_03750 [Burkholderiales bacterium]